MIFDKLLQNSKGELKEFFDVFINSGKQTIMFIHWQKHTLLT